MTAACLPENSAVVIKARSGSKPHVDQIRRMIDDRKSAASERLHMMTSWTVAA